MQHSYPTDFHKSWSAIIEVINEENLPIKTIGKASGVIITDFKTARMDTITKKDSIIAPQAGFALNILVKAVNADTTNIIINSYIERYAGAGWAGNSWAAISGRDTILQDKYFKKLDDKLNK